MPEFKNTAEYEEYVHNQIQFIAGQLTDVMLGDFSVVTRTKVPDDTFGYLCSMINIAINAGRNAQKELVRRNEELLASTVSKRQYENIFALSPDFIFKSKIDDFGFVQTNSRASDFYGYSKEEFLGMQIFDIEVDPPAKEQVRKLYDTITIGQVVEVYGRNRKKNGDIFPVHVRFCKLDNEHVLANVRDITEQKRAEQELFGAKETAAVILENLGDMIEVVNTDFEIQYVNSAHEKNYGYSRNEILGKTPASLFRSGKHSEQYYQEIEKTVKTGELWRGELIAKRKDGSLIYQEAVITPIRDSQGDIYQYVAIKRDIAERKRAEEALKDAKKKAEESDRLKSDFLANISHEIRTPMNGVIGMAELLSNSELSQRQLDFVEAISMSADNLMVIIDDVLDFSKLESKKTEVEKIGFDLRMAAEKVVDTLASQAQKKGLELMLRYKSNTVTDIISGHGPVRQILMNFVGNAIKFTEAGWVLITIEQISANDSQLIKCSVEDSGIGLPQDNIEKLFLEFTQADSSSTRKYGGTGLGLAIAAKLVDILGGEIGAENRPGGGSKFWFTFPLIEDDQAKALKPMRAESLNDVRVLIVDDIEINRKILHEQISSWGMRNSRLANGKEALPALKEAKKQGDAYQIVLLDYQMPGMNGEQVGEAIKNDPAIADTVLIMLTSMGGNDNSQRLLNKGFAGYLHKPIHQSQLLDVLTMSWIAFQTKNPQLFTTHSADKQRQRQIDSKDRGLGALVVEDNIVNSKVAEKMLERLGCRVTAVANGLECLAILERVSFDIIFMDLQMPEMDGLAATKAIRELSDKKKASVPIVAMTAHAMAKDRNRCLQAGMDDYIAKPVKMRNFEAALNKWVKDV